jgi:NAD(P)-dependent dehydrogenase (short-subunit alcohol dehydrogenase family)
MSFDLSAGQDEPGEGSSTAYGLLSGRRAVVTGAGDIGGVIARELHRHGAAVTVWDRSEQALQRLSDGTDGLSTRAVDVTSWEDVQASAEAAIAAMGGVDVLVNSAAIATFAPVSMLDPEDWRRTIDVNLTGVFLTCKGFVSHMTENGGGSIVNISSIGGLRGEPEFSHYCAAKFGVIGFTQSLAREVGEHGVRVNAVCPGAVESTMNTDTMARDARRLGVPIGDIEQAILRKTAMRRLTKPTDVADAVVFFASDLASFVTGEALAVTGGVF